MSPRCNPCTHLLPHHRPCRSYSRLFLALLVIYVAEPLLSQVGAPVSGTGSPGIARCWRRQTLAAPHGARGRTPAPSTRLPAHPPPPPAAAPRPRCTS